MVTYIKLCGVQVAGAHNRHLDGCFHVVGLQQMITLRCATAPPANVISTIHACVRYLYFLVGKDTWIHVHVRRI